ncbi:MAG: type II secretion system F family protein [Oligoflexia bacterium]|nr:type II secretion system F family protein [Oligoflexia bacterium]MBF0364769.1 type II secretion system F family protein [Oligoflexia bacterium]
MIEELLVFLGQNVVIGIFGLIFFILTYRNSVTLFQWIENQTYGRKEFIMNKFEFLHIKVKEEYVVYALLAIAFVIPSLIAAIFAFWGSFVWAAIFFTLFALLGWFIPKPLINYLCQQRIDQYQTQMIDGLNLLTNGIRAGLSMPQSIALVVNEMPAPISQEFNTILQQSKIGSPLEECFENLARRIPTEDNQMFVSSVNILRETGGNLAETFDTIVGVIRERIRLQQKIQSATAQGIMQGITIFCMPFAMALIYYVSDPKSMEIMFVHPLGIALMILAVVLDLIGGFFIYKIVKIKV